jgi:hypothetical protein
MEQLHGIRVRVAERRATGRPAVTQENARRSTPGGNACDESTPSAERRRRA